MKRFLGLFSGAKWVIVIQGVFIGLWATRLVDWEWYMVLAPAMAYVTIIVGFGVLLAWWER